MRIAIVAFGSFGDLRPYAALGQGLQAAGHEVRVVTHAHYREAIGQWGLEAVPLGGDPDAILSGDAGQEWLESGSNPLHYGVRLFRVIAPWLRAYMAACRESCADAEAIIASGLAVFVAAHIAEKLRVPFFPAYLQPITPTSAFPNPFVPLPLPESRQTNRLSHFLFWRGSWSIFRAETNTLRRELLDLPPLPRSSSFGGMDRQRWPMLYGYSPIVVPKPADWAPTVHVTGYWLPPTPAPWVPPDELVAFLRAGPPPLCVGFGSMHTREPQESTALVLRALALTGHRAILLTGWGGLAEVPVSADIFCATALPHEWLFPQMAAVVHHGGAGITAACLRAGVPSIVIPFFGDQVFWGERVERLGVGTAPIPHSRLTANRLAEAIRRVRDAPDMRARAQIFATRLGAEDGVAAAVRVVQEHVAVYQWQPA